MKTKTAVLEAPVQTAAPATPTSGGIKRMSFGAIAPKKEDTKTAYPVYRDDNGQAAILAARIKTRTVELEALEGAIKTDKASLRLRVGPFYWACTNGKSDVPSSLSVQSDAGEVLVTFSGRYPALGDAEAAVTALLGEARVARCFRQQYSYTIAGDQIPEANAGAFMTELQELLAKHGATDALEVKDAIRPVASFHAERHSLLTPEENVALEVIYPLVAMIKTKGRGEAK